MGIPPEIVADPGSQDVERWMKRLPLGDAAILVAATRAQTDYLITGDKHFTEDPRIAKEAKLHIITPDAGKFPGITGTRRRVNH